MTDGNTTLFVGNLGKTTTIKKLKKQFSNYGIVIDCFMPTSLVDESCGFAYVKFETKENADAAIRDTQGKQFEASFSLLDTESLVFLPLLNLLCTEISENDPAVHSGMKNAASFLDKQKDTHQSKQLRPFFQSYLDTSGTSNNQSDRMQKTIIFLLGSYSRHLCPADPKVLIIKDYFLYLLYAPSYAVQKESALALSPLIKKSDGQEMIQNFEQAIYANNADVTTKKGAALGLAAVVKACGIIALREYNIISSVYESIQTKVTEKKEGACFIIRALMVLLGRLFEPYAVKLMPHVLTCMGDGKSVNVRDAAEAAGDEIVKYLSESKTSGPGVTLVLPSLLDGLNSRAWRTKLAAVHMFGEMSHCGPEQLSLFLPKIVPTLIEVLFDSKKEVAAAANKALHQIGDVIENPEIRKIVPDLFKGIAEPVKETASTLKVLINTNFVHFIDPPSLALIMPILKRALKDSQTTIKLQASQIIGNMAALTKIVDIIPYLSEVLALLKVVLVDSTPDIRKAAAVAMGSMVRGIGENYFSDLIPWLIQACQSDESEADRTGAALGLCEVLDGIGSERLVKFMPSHIAMCDAATGKSREGLLQVYVFLPEIFEFELRPYIPPMVLSIKKAMGDEMESVRDQALHAGQMMIKKYGDYCLELFLPILIEGMTSESHRIRFSSVHLLGDLMFHVAGCFGYQGGQYAQDMDNLSTPETTNLLFKTLGKKRCSKVFSLLWLVRMDTNKANQTLARHVWKVVIFNTVIILKEIQSYVVAAIIEAMASPIKALQATAHGAFNEAVTKIGIRNIPTFMPLLNSYKDSENEKVREAVALCLLDSINIAGLDSISYYVESISPLMVNSMLDPSEIVRTAGASSYTQLHDFMQESAVKAIFPLVFNTMNDDEVGPLGLDSVKKIMKSCKTISPIVAYLQAFPTDKDVQPTEKISITLEEFRTRGLAIETKQKLALENKKKGPVNRKPNRKKK